MKFLYVLTVCVWFISLVVESDAGIIAGTYDDWGWGDDPAQIRYFPDYPGIDENLRDPSRLVFSQEDIKVTSIDNDSRKKLLYMYDRRTSQIWIANNFSAGMDKEHMEFKIMHYVMSPGTPQIAYDWLSGTLYWCDTQVKTIFAAPGDWNKVDADYYKIISHGHFDAPDGIGIDPRKALLFILDSGPSPKITRMNTDGTNGHTIVTRDLNTPATLEVDIFDETIYWIDTWTDTIESVDYYGQTRRLLKSYNFVILSDIAIYKDMLYVTESLFEYLYTYNKTTMEVAAEDISLSHMDEAMYALSVYDEETQPLLPKDYCGELNCEHLCLSQVEKAVCACTEGYKLNEDERTCREVNGTFNKAFVYANASHMCLVDIRSVANFGKFKPKCIFTTIKKVQTTTTVSTTTPPTTTKSTTVLMTTSLANDTDVDTNDTADNTTTVVTNYPTTRTTTRKPPPTVAPGDAIKMFELDMKDRYAFIVTQDNRILQRSLGLDIDSDTATQITIETVDITGISFDPMDRNLYWSLSNGQIFEHDIVEGGTKDITIAERPESPKDLHVLIDQRKLAFISAGHDIKTIEFDGTGIQTVATHSEVISNLILDREKQLFYFMSNDVGEIYSVPLSGDEEPDTEHYYISEKTTILRQYHNYVIWVYSLPGQPNVLQSAFKLNLHSDMSTGSFDNVSTIVDLQILDYQLQETKPGLCNVDNGGCEHFCFSKLVNGDLTKVCECKKGYHIVNGNNCSAIPLNDDFLIFLDWTTDEILQFDLNDFSLNAIPVRESYLYSGIFLDQVSKNLIWSIHYESEVYSSRLDGHDTKLLADVGSTYPQQFAKDYSTGNLYYFSSYNQHLGLISPHGHVLWFDDDFGWDTIRCIDIHPGLGKIYYGINQYDEGYIGRADLDGTNHEILIQDERIVDPRGLAIDYLNNHLYIGDFEMDTVLQCDLDGQNCIAIVNTTEMQILDLETDGDYLYYSSASRGFIVRVDLTPPYETHLIGQGDGLGRVNTMSVYRSSSMNKPPVQNACSHNDGKADCSTICIPKPNGKVCKCQDGVYLQPDGLTCSDVHQCDAIFESLANGTNEKIEIVIENKCLRRAGHVCEFKCPINYVPINASVTSLTCIDDGPWDLQNHSLCVELQCPKTFNGGYVGDDCSRYPGRVCDYTCDFGSVRKQSKIFCQHDGTWHGVEEGVCETYRCSADIANGMVDPDCDRTLGDICKFTCNKYYNYAPTAVHQTITCGTNGWDMDTETLCIDALCDSSTLTNGVIETGCDSKIGHACKYSCDRSFVNSSVEIFCKTDQKWHPSSACESMFCPKVIDKGKINETCTRRVDSVCQYECHKLYVKSDVVSVQCLANGQWNQTDNLCLVPQPKPEASSFTEAEKKGLVTGVIVLAVIIVILAIAMIFFFKRRKSSSMSLENNLALSNPAYY